LRILAFLADYGVYSILWHFSLSRHVSLCQHMSFLDIFLEQSGDRRLDVHDFARIAA
jgi:hypothetical protein